MIKKLQILSFSLFFIFNFINRDISNIFLLATLFTCICDIKSIKETFKENSYLVISVIVFTVWITLVGVYHSAPLHELDNYYRLFLLLPLLVINMNKKIWSKIIVYSSLAACIHLAYSYLSFDILRFHGTSGHPITYANMVVTIMLLLLLGMKDYGSSKKILLLIILLTLGLLTAWVLTQTRGHVIGFLISLALIIFWLRNKNIFLFSILSLGVLFYFQNSLSERLTKLADLDINILDKTTIEKVLRSHSSKYVPLRERGTYFFYGFSTINKYPYTGIGPQNVEDDMKGYIKETGYLAVSRDHLHNDYIDISAKFGLPSLLLLLIIYYCMFVNVNNENRQLFIIFMIMLLTSQLSQSQFAHNQAIVFFIASLFVLKSTNKSNI